jgi:hypothetical protein
MFDIYFYGALRVLIDSFTGALVAVQDRISGEAASLRYSPDYISRAVSAAMLAHESQREVA